MPRRRHLLPQATAAAAAGLWALLVGQTACAQARTDAATDSPPAAGATAATAPLPRWELGLGLGALQLPHYRGSDQRYTLLLPVPYAVWRGDILRADREGTRALLFNADALEFDISVAAGNPTRSSDNQARAGMDNLAPTLELGPKLNWTLWRGTGRAKLELKLPLRAVATLGRSSRVIGWTSNPQVNLDLPAQAGWRIGLVGGPQFASRGYHGYYYDVPTAQATASRPAFQADGGFAGWTALAAVSRQDGDRWLGAFLRADSLAGTGIAHSPLVRERQQWAAGVAVSWVLWKSESRVDWPR